MTVASPPGPGGPGPSKRRIFAWTLLVLALVGVGGATLHQRLTRPAPPPILGRLPGFTLTNRDGRPVSLADLAGRPWIADFIFTRCGVSCPLMTQRMAKLARELPRAGEVRFVSFTVDPAYDTPAVLEAYARKENAPPSWLFLTGGRDEIFHLCEKGFLLPVDPNPPPGAAAPGELILHSTRFVLVDGKGRLRGFYEGFADETPERIARDLEGLRREER